MYRKYIFFQVLFIAFLIQSKMHCFSSGKKVIVLDPAGHAKDLGRKLVEGYERTQTFQFAQAMKKGIESKYKNVIVVMSRSTGEEILPLQIPSFSNRLNANFFLRIQMYREENEQPKLYFYHLLFNPLVDTVLKQEQSLSLVPLQQAHFNNLHNSRFYGEKMYNYLSRDNYKRHFDCYKLCGRPLAQLIGITAPAILLEIGICRENRWTDLVGPIVNSLSFLGDSIVEVG